MAKNQYHSPMDVHSHQSREDSQDSSDTEAVTPSSISVYTPSSSGERTTIADEESIGEREPLLAEQPPHYEDITPAFEYTAASKGPVEECLQQDKPTTSVNPDTDLYTGIKVNRRKRSKVRRIFLFLKIAFLLGLLFSFVLTICRRAWKIPDNSQHGDCFEDRSHSSQREIVVDRGSNTIWGRWPVYDLLSLTTTSGAIAITIEPQPADPDHPDKPARIVLQTTSGSIAVSFSVPHAASIPEMEMKMDLEANSITADDGQYKPVCTAMRTGSYADGHGIDGISGFLPPRPYELEIRTATGSITGRYIFSTSARIESHSGSISAVLIPLVYSELPSNVTLLTRTWSGSQSLELSEPFITADSNSAELSHEIVGYATSSHITDSGAINIVYPGTWAGAVYATSQGGLTCLNGRRLEVTKDGYGYAVGIRPPSKALQPSEWWGSHGDMNVSLQAQGSGMINFHAKGPK